MVMDEVNAAAAAVAAVAAAPAAAAAEDSGSGQLGWAFDESMALAMGRYRELMVRVTGGDAPDWIDALDEGDEPYYYNTATREAEWRLPHTAYVDAAPRGEPALLGAEELGAAHARSQEVAISLFLREQLRETRARAVLGMVFKKQQQGAARGGGGKRCGKGWRAESRCRGG